MKSLPLQFILLMLPSLIATSCGQSTYSKLEIIGGLPVKMTDPIAQSVAGLVDQNGISKCTLIAISASTFLTAGHCIVSDDEMVNYRLRIGLNINSQAGQSQNEYRLKSWKRHEKYDFTAMISDNPQSPPNDIGVLTAEADIPGIVAVSLAKEGVSLEIDSEILIAGYGRSVAGVPESRGMLLKFPFHLGEIHSQAHEIILIDYHQTQDHMACHGDSGAPVYQEQNGSLMLWGVVSRGANTCIGASTVATDIRSFNPWVTGLLAKIYE